jgi:hypothetical protein
MNFTNTFFHRRVIAVRVLRLLRIALGGWRIFGNFPAFQGRREPLCRLPSGAGRCVRPHHPGTDRDRRPLRARWRLRPRRTPPQSCAGKRLLDLLFLLSVFHEGARTSTLVDRLRCPLGAGGSLPRPLGDGPGYNPATTQAWISRPPPRPDEYDKWLFAEDCFGTICSSPVTVRESRLPRS